jgi:putative ABC transport system permease protein
VLMQVSAIAMDYGGVTVQMPRALLNDLMGDGDVASGANLLVASDARADFYKAVARMPQVVSAGSRDDTVAMFRSAVSAALITEMTFFLGFAGAIAFGIAFNISRIELSDRARDLATLRVLGFTPVECSYILGGEIVLLSLVATPAGILGGIGLAHLMSMGFAAQELYLQLTITPHGLAVAFTVYLGAIVVAMALVAQRIWHFDLVAVLKTRD